MSLKLIIESQVLDLFQDENISIVSSIGNIQDISKITTDYSQSFTVPANEKNNLIFKHYYNADLDNSFDARTAINGRIEIDGFVFKEGKWKLESVEVKDGFPSSYSINFRGNLTSIRDLIADDKLSSLDLSAFNHEFSDTNVRTGLTSALFSGDVIYNLFARKQYYYNSAADNTNTDKLANIANAGGSNTGVNYNELRPSLKVIRILKAIEDKYGFTFSRDFFGRSEFKQLFTWVSKDANTNFIVASEKINFTTGDLTDYGMDFTTDTLTTTNTKITNYVHQITVNTTSPQKYWVVVKNNGEEIIRLERTGSFVSPNTTLPQGDLVLEWFIESYGSFTYSTQVNFKKVSGGTGATRYANSPSTTLTREIKIADNLPEIKTFDFLKGLFSMFKLVVIPTSENTFYVNTLKDYYQAGTIRHLDEWIDIESVKIDRGTILNTLKFEFEEPSTILNIKFKANEGKGYGDEIAYLKDENNKLLDGDSLEVKVPFEQIIYEHLYNRDTGGDTGIQYAAILTETLDPASPKMHLFYNLHVNPVNPIGFITDAGKSGTPITELNIPSHTLEYINPFHSTTFSEEFNEFTGEIMEGNLYSNYWKNYVESIFSIKKREYTFTAKNLPLRILKDIRLNDIIKIKSSYYRIDNMNTNLTTNQIDFKLVPVFNEQLNNMKTDTPIMYFDKNAQTRSSYIANLGNYTLASDSWIGATTSSLNPQILDIIVLSNSGTDGRAGVLTITDTDTSEVLNIDILQTGTAW